jgi:hypothetical protein
VSITVERHNNTARNKLGAGGSAVPAGRKSVQRMGNMDTLQGRETKGRPP